MCRLRAEAELHKVNKLIDHLKAALAIAESQAEMIIMEYKGVDTSTAPEWSLVDGGTASVQ